MPPHRRLSHSRESADRDEPSQDYFLAEHSPGRLCFAVTDGVGSSFLGDLAARMLAEMAVEWLSSLHELPNEPELAAGLERTLLHATPNADEIIASYRLPDSIDGLARDALERQRAYGSEAMLACARIEWPRTGATRVGIAWLGDVCLRVLGSDGAGRDFTGRTADRWSSRRGPRGSVGARVWTAGEVERVIACSDGLLPELEAAVTLGDAQLEQRLLALAAGEVSDDIVLVDVAVSGRPLPPVGGSLAVLERQPPPAPERIAPGADLAAPTDLAVHGSAAHSSLSWSPTPGADGYIVELADDAAFREPVVYRTVPPLLHAPATAARMWVRVRATTGTTMGPWSEVRVPGARETEQNEVRVRVDALTSETVLDWTDVPGARSYAIEIDDDPRYSPRNRRVTSPPFRFNRYSGRRYQIQYHGGAALARMDTLRRFRRHRQEPAMTQPYERFNADKFMNARIELGFGSLRLTIQSQAGLGDTVFQRAGKKADVVRGKVDGQDRAVKVFKRRFAIPENAVITEQLKRFRDVPGLTVCQRQVILGALVEGAGLSGLEWAIVMPWIPGYPWAAYLEERSSLTRPVSLGLARAAADVLAGLERRELVHADISSTNVFVRTLSPPAIELIDVEDMYHPQFVDIQYKPDGSPGYQHPTSTTTTTTTTTRLSTQALECPAKRGRSSRRGPSVLARISVIACSCAVAIVRGGKSRLGAGAAAGGP